MKINQSRQLVQVASFMNLKRSCVSSLCLLMLCVAFGTSSLAQEYPARPIKVIVPFSPGGSVDLIARVVGQKMATALGQPLVIENRPGAGGNIGTDAVAKARADGYTLLVASNAYAVNPTLYHNMPFNPTKDLVAVGLIAAAPNILVVNPSVPAQTLPEFVALAKRETVMYASAGSGTTTHLAAALLSSVAGIKLIQIPYRSGGPAMNDVMSGQVKAMFAGIITAVPFLKTHKLRPIAVTSPERSKAVPDVPTFAESGYPGYETMNWYVLMAPAGTPVPIIEKLNRQLNLALKDVNVSALLMRQGAEPTPGTPAAAQAHIRQEMAKWRKVIKTAGIQPVN